MIPDSDGVYITGMGVISSLGNTPNDMFESLRQGLSGVRRMPGWENYKGLNCHLGAPAMPYDSKALPRSARRTMSPMSEMAVLATYQALNQADLSPDNINSPRTAVIMGSTTGSPETMETYFRKLFERGGPEGQISTSFFKVMNHSVAANVASALNFRGALVSPSCACATSSQSVILGWEMIRSGEYDLVIAGGADEIHYISCSIFDIVYATSRGFNDRPELTPSPFDKNRDGLVVSEGAGVVILESAERVRQRRVRALAELRGGAYLCDGSHMSQSSCEAMVQTMGLALKRAGLAASHIDYVNAHATGTRQGDVEEALAIGRVFAKETPVSSLKGHLGHSLAACGTTEIIASIKMMDEGLLIPTRNLQEADPDCGDINLIKELVPRRVDNVLSNNFAFGGMNVSLVLSRVGEGK
jgi:3-oxoacyl-[acyl-carrier-protein] synthase II